MKELMRNRYLLFVCWTLLSILILFFDYLAGPMIRFPILLIFPVSLATWFNGIVWGLLLAFFLPIIRLILEGGSAESWISLDALINSFDQILTLGGFSLLIYWTSRQYAKIKILQGLLPICSFCKKIRNKEKDWLLLEEYIALHSEAEFTHGICPECAKQHYGIILKEKQEI
ncbi:MAG: hypothetical protein V1878_03475 [bacterium]